MPDTTPNYQLTLPTFDQRFWHDDMSRALRAFDTLIARYAAVGNVKGVWANSTTYAIGERLIDPEVGNLYECAVGHVSAATGTFATDRAAKPQHWINAQITNRFRGAWAASTAYRTGDFVVSGNKYAVAANNFTSSASFTVDETAGNFITLINLSAIPASAVPVPNVSTALHFVRQNSAGDGYEVIPASTVQSALSLGALAVLSSVSQAYISSGAASTKFTLQADGAGAATFAVQATPNYGYVRLADVGLTSQLFTSGTWNTCRITTELEDADALCSLSSNRITLSAGTYRIVASVVLYGTLYSSIRLRNVTDNSTLLVGRGAYSPASGPSTVVGISGPFTIAASKELELQIHAGQTSAAGNLTFPSPGENVHQSIIEIVRLNT